MTTTELDRALATAGTVAAIATSADSAVSRAEAILEELRGLVPFVAAELTQLDPLTGQQVVMATEGYSEEVIDDLNSEQFHGIMEALRLPETGRPVRMKDLPGDPLDNWAVADVLIPAGFQEGMTMCLRTSDGRFTGVLNLSTTSTQHPSDVARDVIAHLCTALGNLADPLQSGRWMSLLVGATTPVIGLDDQGSTIDIPGIAGHRLLAGDSELMEVARASARVQSWSSFVWPDGDEDWFRVKVMPCQGGEPIATLVSLDACDIGPLTRRELEVLTLATEGLSNAEIARRLVISDRTVTTHVEHILDKLAAPNRAAAAAHALRNGLILGRVS